MLQVKENGLTPEIYEHLRELVCFQYYDQADVEIALQNTLYSVVIYMDERPIGIARVIGDGRVVFLIKDVVVDPKYQHQGIGDMIMQYLMAYVHRIGCANAYVGLMSTPGKESFYKRYGFQIRACEGLGSGMTQLINREEGNDVKCSDFRKYEYGSDHSDRVDSAGW